MTRTMSPCSSFPNYLSHMHICIMLKMLILFCIITMQSRWGTIDDFSTIPFHHVLFSATLVYAHPCLLFTIVSHFFFYLFSFVSFIVPFRIVFAKPEDFKGDPLFTKVRNLSYSPTATWIFLRTFSWLCDIM